MAFSTIARREVMAKLRAEAEAAEAAGQDRTADLLRDQAGQIMSCPACEVCEVYGAPLHPESLKPWCPYTGAPL